MTAVPPASGFQAAVRSGGRPLRFLIGGAINTAVGLALYPALLWLFPLLRVHYLVALGIAQAVCVLFAFAIYKIGVFRSSARSWRELGTFLSFYAVNYAANWLALPLLVGAAHIPPAIAQTGFSLVLMASSYFWHSRLTFKPTGTRR